jgi:hypothetical protein
MPTSYSLATELQKSIRKCVKLRRTNGFLSEMFIWLAIITRGYSFRKGQLCHAEECVSWQGTVFQLS